MKNIRVKIIGNGLGNALRQLPGNERAWGGCLFTSDAGERDYDWLVVYNDLTKKHPVEPLACPRENTLLITNEPPNIKVYGKKFAAQFGHVLTAHTARELPHPNRIFSQQGMVWWYGRGRDGTMIPYDVLKASPPLAKTKLFSTVCSDKRQRHTLHNRRYVLTQAVKKTIPELDIFGHGIAAINDKAEALDAYKYHLAVENFIGPHYWTEKLADAFLGATLPFYAGAPNAADYFPKESFIPVDLYDTEGTIQIIREAIRGNEYEKRLPAIMEARRRILDEYNLFAVVADIVHQKNIKNKINHCVFVKSRRRMRIMHPITEAIPLFWEKTLRKIKNWDLLPNAEKNHKDF